MAKLDNIRSLFRWLSRSLIPHAFAVTLVVVVWSNRAFCGEIHDAAQTGDLAKVKVLVKNNPDLVFSGDESGMTALHFAAFYGHKDVAECARRAGLPVAPDDKRIGGDVARHLPIAVLQQRP